MSARPFLYEMSLCERGEEELYDLLYDDFAFTLLWFFYQAKLEMRVDELTTLMAIFYSFLFAFATCLGWGIQGYNHFSCVAIFAINTTHTFTYYVEFDAALWIISCVRMRGLLIVTGDYIGR